MPPNLLLKLASAMIASKIEAESSLNAPFLATSGRDEHESSAELHSQALGYACTIVMSMLYGVVDVDIVIDWCGDGVHGAPVGYAELDLAYSRRDEGGSYYPLHSIQ